MPGYFAKIKTLALNLVYGKSGFPRVVNGSSFRCIPDKRWYFSSEYDKTVADYFKFKIKPGDICVSIGSNMGIYPLQFANWTGPSGRVYAFEPNPQAISIMKKHIALNGYSNCISVYEKAVSNSLGKASFHASASDGMSRLGKENPLLKGRTDIIAVDVTTLDHEFKGKPIGALMMDIEGFEIAALQGGLHFLKSHLAKAIVIEMHPNAWVIAGTTRADFEQLLMDCSLRAIPLSGQKDALAEYGHIALEPI
jgi:FkbM family methyltransferase